VNERGQRPFLSTIKGSWLSRILAILALLAALVIVVPAAQAATPTAPISPVTGTSFTGDPITPARFQLRAARAVAINAYRHAHLLAQRAGIRVHRPPMLTRSSSIRQLYRARLVWLRRGESYRVILHRRGRVVATVLHELGRPYVWGGASPAGFDCSGLVMWTYHHVGVNLPHSTYAMIGRGRLVSRRAIRPGDLVFLEGGGHVGIYIGHGTIVHAPHAGTVVKQESLSGWTITAIRRII
jgi:cell wall-associated NlpC family hydrolase